MRSRWVKVMGAVALAVLVAGCSRGPDETRIGDKREAKPLRVACTKAGEEATRGQPRVRVPEGIKSVTTRDIGDLRRLPALILCEAVTQAGAICERNNRAAIVDRISSYYRMHAKILRNATKAGEKDLAFVKPFLNNDLHRQVEQAIERHIQAGRLIASDFAKMPPQLAARFAAVPNPPNACLTDRAWVAPPARPRA